MKEKKQRISKPSDYYRKLPLFKISLIILLLCSVSLNIYLGMKKTSTELYQKLVTCPPGTESPMCTLSAHPPIDLTGVTYKKTSDWTFSTGRLQVSGTSKTYSCYTFTVESGSTFFVDMTYLVKNYCGNFPTVTINYTLKNTTCKKNVKIEKNLSSYLTYGDDKTGSYETKQTTKNNLAPLPLYTFSNNVLTVTAGYTKADRQNISTDYQKCEDTKEKEYEIAGEREQSEELQCIQGPQYPLMFSGLTFIVQGDYSTGITVDLTKLLTNACAPKGNFYTAGNYPSITIKYEP